MKNNIKGLFVVLLSLGASLAMAQNNTFPTTGNVGVGTTAPQSKLEINGGLAITGRNTVNGINNFANALQIVSVGTGAIVFNPGQATQQMFGFHTNGNMYWGGLSAYSMILSNAGDLRIMKSLAVGSTLKPGSQLSVSGKLSAKEVEVTTTNWPDYVFHKDYDLKSLSEVEAYIQEYGHLPDMPSAKEVEANGVQLGDMVSKLLKKNEELTLHLIAKDKLIEQQQQQLNSILQRLEKIENNEQ